MENFGAKEIFERCFYDLENLVPPEKVKDLRMEDVFENYDDLVEEIGKSGEKRVRKLNKSVKDFWWEVDDIFVKKFSRSFFDWFAEYYYEVPLGLKDVHKLFTIVIKPKSLCWAAFYRFIVQRTFVDTRGRQESLQIPLARERLVKRPRVELTKEELSERSINGWKTRREKFNRDLLEIVKDLKN